MNPLTVTCPTCGAKPSERCRDPNHPDRALIHRARWQAIGITDPTDAQIDQADHEIAYIGIEIGVAGGLNRQALRKAIRGVQKLITHISPLTAIDIGIGGYAHDPREIYQIREARLFILDFAVGLVKAGIPLDRLLPTSVNLVRCCIAAERGVEVVVTDTPEIDITGDVAAHRERARRSMH
jgi:hypothetical protein